MTTCTICIATYKRTDGLRALLDSIETQVLGPDVVVDIIVVDNDPESARSVVEQFGGTSRFEVQYLTQPEQNISLTRNLAVGAATGALVWFVDDDETALPTTLAELMDALVQFDADCVFGPVLPKFVGDHPDWILTSSAFNRSIHQTGTRSRANRTSNTLIAASVLNMVPGPFDKEYGISGGSDSMLFRQLERMGAKFIDSEKGAVVEIVPESRANWTWMRDRCRRHGQNYGRQTVSLAGKVTDWSVLLVIGKAAAQVVVASVFVAFGKRQTHKRTEARLRLWNNVGKLEGVTGVITERSL